MLQTGQQYVQRFYNRQAMMAFVFAVEHLVFPDDPVNAIMCGHYNGVCGSSHPSRTGYAVPINAHLFDGTHNHPRLISQGRYNRGNCVDCENCPVPIPGRGMLKPNDGSIALARYQALRMTIGESSDDFDPYEIVFGNLAGRTRANWFRV